MSSLSLCTIRYLFKINHVARPFYICYNGSMKHALRIFLLLVLLTGAITVTGCKEQPFDKAADAFFSALRQRDYARMENLLTPVSANQAPLETLTQYYDKVYNLLGVTGITTQINDAQQTADRAVFHYTLTLQTQSCGTLSYQSVLEVERKLNYYLINWSPANVLPKMQWEDRIFKSTVKGKRGEIFDCNGYPLIVNEYALTFYVNPQTADISAVAAGVGEALSLETEPLRTAMELAKTRGQDTCVLATYLKGILPAEKEEAALNVTGVKLDRDSITPVRRQLRDSVASHVLGFSTPVTSEDRQNPAFKDLPEGTRIGRTGVESVCNQRLLGTDGFEIYLLSADSKTKTVLFTQPAVNGQDIKLTIDILLQEKAEKELATRYAADASNGSVVIIEPTTGAVKVLASYPTFSLNLYAKNQPEKGAADLYKEDSGSPTLNRATQGLYPPGSVMKCFTALMGLDSGVVEVTTRFPYENDIEQQSETTDGWRPRGSYWSKLIIRQRYRSAQNMPLDMNRGLIWSDNIYFGWLGMQVGAQNFMAYCNELGLGSGWSFDLPLKASSLCNKETDLTESGNLKLLADSAYGQGEVLITPLQLAATVSLFGNGGNIMQPYIIAAYCTTNGENCLVEQETTQPKQLFAGFAGAAKVRAVSNIMERVYSEGSGEAGYVRGISVAGKTGTAQTGNGVTEIGWYAGQVTKGGLPYTFLVHVEGPKNNTGAAKFGTTKAVLEMLKTDG